MYLYDIQTNTKLTLNQAASTAEIPASSYIKGKNSGATGYTVADAGGLTDISVRETSGTFMVGEAIQVNGIDFPRTIVASRVFNTQSIKSFKQDDFANTGIATFTADATLDRFRFIGGIEQVEISAPSNGKCTVTAPGRQFNVRVGTVVRYQEAGEATETYSKIAEVADDNASFKIEALGQSVTGVYKGSLPSSSLQANMFPTATRIRGTSDGYLYSMVPHQNIANVSLSNSTLTISVQLTGQTITNNSYPRCPQRGCGLLHPARRHRGPLPRHHHRHRGPTCRLLCRDHGRPRKHPQVRHPTRLRRELQWVCH